MSDTRDTRVVTDPHTQRLIRVPAHIYAPERTKAPVPMRDWLNRSAASSAPAEAQHTRANEAGRVKESGR